MQAYLTDFLAYLGVDSVVAEEVALFPGVDEIFSAHAHTARDRVRELRAWLSWTARPTAGTLRLLTFTDSSSSKLNKLIDVERTILKLIRPVGKRFKNFKAVIPEDQLYETLGRGHRRDRTPGRNPQRFAAHLRAPRTKPRSHRRGRDSTLVHLLRAFRVSRWTPSA